jgi:hypothetical protein
MKDMEVPSIDIGSIGHLPILSDNIPIGMRVIMEIMEGMAVIKPSWNFEAPTLTIKRGRIGLVIDEAKKKKRVIPSMR